MGGGGNYFLTLATGAAGGSAEGLCGAGVAGVPPPVTFFKPAVQNALAGFTTAAAEAAAAAAAADAPPPPAPPAPPAPPPVEPPLFGAFALSVAWNMTPSWPSKCCVSSSLTALHKASVVSVARGLCGLSQRYDPIMPQVFPPPKAMPNVCRSADVMKYGWRSTSRASGGLSDSIQVRRKWREGS
jgi:hypothetical protein